MRGAAYSVGERELLMKMHEQGKAILKAQTVFPRIPQTHHQLRFLIRRILQPERQI
jgi:hypothetical protein